MARIRTIKPQFFLNEQLAELPFSDRLLFVGLWLEADKAGRLEDRPMRLKAALFPYDDLSVDEGLGRLANAGLIVRYDGNGVRLIQIPGWEKHQRPNHREPDSLFPADSADIGVPVHAEAEGKGMERKGREQEGKGSLARRARDLFEAFWQEYPRKVGKDAAWAVWQRLRPSDVVAEAMVAAVRAQAQSSQWRKDGGQFIPHPRTWLGQGRWQDAPDNHSEEDGMDGLREFVRG